MNADLPPQWIIYVIVEDLDRSLEACRAGGGSLIGDIRGAEHGSRFCIIRDPAGAVMGLMENPPAGSE